MTRLAAFHRARRKRLEAHADVDVCELPRRCVWTAVIGVGACVAQFGVAVYVGRASVWHGGVVATVASVALVVGAAWMVGAWMEALMFGAAHEAVHRVVFGREHALSGWWGRRILVAASTAVSWNPLMYYYCHFHLLHHSALGRVPGDIGDFVDRDWDAGRFAMYARVSELRYQGLTTHIGDAAERWGVLQGRWGHHVLLTASLALKSVLELRDRIASALFLCFQLVCDAAGFRTLVSRAVPPPDEVSARGEHAVTQYWRDLARWQRSVYRTVGEYSADTLLTTAAVGLAWWLGGAGSIAYLWTSSLCFYGALRHPLLALWLAFHVRPRAGPGEDSDCVPTGSVGTWWMNALTCNLGLHAQHHDMPYVPWTVLGRLRKDAPGLYQGEQYSQDVWTVIDRFERTPFSQLQYACPLP